jgi:hypothetical protein
MFFKKNYNKIDFFLKKKKKKRDYFRIYLAHHVYSIIK